MKKTILLLIILLSILVLTTEFSSAISLEKNATGSSLIEEKLEKIKELKERVAEKVSQLKERELDQIIGEDRKIYAGEIKSIENEMIILEKNKQEIRIEVSNKTKLMWVNTNGKKLNLTLSDFTPGDYITAWGKINKDTGVMTADVISGRLKPFIFSCQVTKINEEEKFILCQNEDRNYQIILSNNSRILVLMNDGILQEEKLTEIKPKTKLIVRGVLKEKSKEKITALLIINL